MQPSPDCPAFPQVPEDEERPAVCVDWCDAWAYCLAVGKRLCGAIGGGANGFADFADPARRQWYNACTACGQLAYPYGQIYDGTRCNTKDVGPADDAGNEQSAPVDTFKDCQSSVAGYTGIYHLSGNVEEWTDACDGTSSANDHCRVRGGSFDTPAERAACAYGGDELRKTANAFVGFRCCWDPAP
ncbi:MAG: SUMF1/EgtB/PvdO family nonheme iron enzyme [Deltaproteobacteria bacterium]|nr:SUMF1/EgtB/PvdO family nonheme iron enzyme [Deltaproteobacteria bacterium]